MTYTATATTPGYEEGEEVDTTDWPPSKVAAWLRTGRLA